jgi:hypothetical protein
MTYASGGLACSVSRWSGRPGFFRVAQGLRYGPWWASISSSASPSNEPPVAYVSAASHGLPNRSFWEDRRSKTDPRSWILLVPGGEFSPIFSASLRVPGRQTCKALEPIFQDRSSRRLCTRPVRDVTSVQQRRRCRGRRTARLTVASPKSWRGERSRRLFSSVPCGPGVGWRSTGGNLGRDFSVLSLEFIRL